MAKSNLRHKANNNLTVEQKFDKVFQCGLDFRIFNKPVQFDQIWDIRIFWSHQFFHVIEPPDEILCPEDGFVNVDDCLDNMIKYIENHDKT